MVAGIGAVTYMSSSGGFFFGDVSSLTLREVAEKGLSVKCEYRVPFFNGYATITLYVREGKDLRIESTIEDLDLTSVVVVKDYASDSPTAYLGMKEDGKTTFIQDIAGGGALGATVTGRSLMDWKQALDKPLKNFTYLPEEQVESSCSLWNPDPNLFKVE